MGMYTALMEEIQKGLEAIKKEKRQLVEITRGGKILSKPFSLTETPEEHRSNS